MMRPSIFRTLLTLSFLFLFVYSALEASDAMEKEIPLPITEINDVLARWWEGAGYRVHHTDRDNGEITLYAVKADESWQADLIPRSALATRVTLRKAGGGSEIRRDQLWEYLSHYLQFPSSVVPPESDQRIPTIILSKIESVVCINAQSEEKNVQFSGFIVDPGGLVLCTAHDLLGPQNFTVTLFDGREIKGKLLFKDSERDIALIQIPLKTKAAISLSDGRDLLGMGEAVYTVGCPVNLRGTVYAGVINGPPRRMNDQLLWQAQMEIYPGSSGSPVFDTQGNVAAMVKGRYRGTSTTAFLIPMETIYHFLKEKSPL